MTYPDEVTPEELEEAVARRLWDIDPRRWPHKPDLILGGFRHTDVTGDSGLTYGDMARECVRLMQWARRHTVSLDGSDLGDCEIVRDPLSLPDPDWRPE